MRVTHAMLNRQLMTSAASAYERMATLDLYSRVTTASDDPAAAQQMIKVRQMIGLNEQYQSNVDNCQRWLLGADTALSSLTDAYDSVRELALTASDGSVELDSEGILASLDSSIDLIMSLANTRVGNSYIFGGSCLNGEPFELRDQGMIYRGDDRVLNAPISSGLSLSYNVPGSALFGSEQATLTGTADWDPVITWDTPLDALLDGAGVEAGSIKITTAAGETTVVDISAARTLGELSELLEAEVPGLSVEIVDGKNLSLHCEGALAAEDVEGGICAQLMGLSGSSVDGVLTSRDLDPALTEDTMISDLQGLPLPLESIAVSVGYDSEPVKLDLSMAETVGDVMEIISNEFAELSVEIDPSGSRLLISSQGFVPFSIMSAGSEDWTASNMGLEGEASPNRPLDMLLDLREAVENQDYAAVSDLLPEIEAVQQRITEEHGRVGSLLSLAEDSQYNLESRNLAMIETLSKLGDADLSETLMLYENAEASYQASLMLASNIYQLTLASFL